MTAKGQALSMSVGVNPDDLPDGWAGAVLGDISVRIQYGYTASATQGDGPRFLRITDIQDGIVNWDSVPSCKVSAFDVQKYGLDDGDIVFARTGATTGKSFLIHKCPPAVFASYLIRVRAHRLVKPSFLFQFFNTPQYWAFISENVAGNAQPNCNASKLAALLFPLPPEREQDRIVVKLESLFEHVTACREQLAKAPRILRAFRHSVLAAACSGRMTEDWREKQTQVQTGEQLAEQIRNIRLKKAKGKKAIEPVFTDFEGILDLPDTWRWVIFGSVIGELLNGISTKPEPQPPGNPILRISSVRSGIVLLDDCRYLPDSNDLINRNRLKDGDLLFTRYNGSLELLGVCGMVRGLGNGVLLYPDKLMRVRFDHPLILPSYAELYFQSAGARDRLTGRSKSSAGQQGISGSDVKAQPFALAPLEEQQEIVRRVEILFKLADKIENRVNDATKRADKLTHAILTKAFRGELVPTEAELARRAGRAYETAEQLLLRIKNELASSTGREEKGHRKRGRGRMR